MNLDPVGAVLDVASGPQDHVVDGVHDLGVPERAIVGDESPSGAADDTGIKLKE